MCAPGNGIQTAGGNCTACSLGSYQPGGGTTCLACQSSTFYPPVGGLNPPAWSVVISSNGTTLYTGSFTEASCVPTQTQMSPEAGQAFWNASLAASLASTPGNAGAGKFAIVKTSSHAACINACQNTTLLSAFNVPNANNFPGRLCLTQYDGANCSIAAMIPLQSGASTIDRLYYKLPPATLGSASKLHNNKAVKASMMSSGFYAIGTLPEAPASPYNLWTSIGSPLTADARTFAANQALLRDGPITGQSSAASIKACKTKCDNSDVCVMFFASVTPTSVTCWYRGGIDALATRSFAMLPPASSVSPSYDSLAW